MPILIVGLSMLAVFLSGLSLGIVIGNHGGRSTPIRIGRSKARRKQ